MKRGKNVMATNTNIWNQPFKPLCVQINRRGVAMAVVSLLIKPDRH